MNENLSLSATRRTADAAIATMRNALGAVLAVEAVVALLLVVVPAWLVHGAAGELAGARAAGALLGWAALLQVPGLFDPVRYRLSVMLGMAGRAAVGVVCVVVGAGYAAIGVIAVAVALGLLVLFHGMVAAVLSSRP